MKTYQFLIIAFLLAIVATASAAHYFKRPRTVVLDSTEPEAPMLEPA